MAVADIECANRASLSFDSSDVLEDTVSSLIKASSTASMCFSGGSGDCMLPAAPTSVSGSSGVVVVGSGESALLGLIVKSRACCVLSDLVT